MLAALCNESFLSFYEPTSKFLTTADASHPEPFKYSIQPRDEQAIALIRSIIDDADPSEQVHTDELKALMDNV